MTQPSKSLEEIIDLTQHPLADTHYQQACKRDINKHGVLVLDGFLTPQAIDAVRNEGKQKQNLAYYTASDHNVYLAPSDPAYPADHIRNRSVTSSKGCITTDQIPEDSPLRSLYNNQEFKTFLCAVLEENSLHHYADPLSSINLHYAAAGQELGWHYDNSSFAITLLIQKPEAGGTFEYVKDARNADEGNMAHEFTERILDGEVQPRCLNMQEGSLVLFRGKNSIHRVTPTIGDVTRMLVVLAYNKESGVSLSESARMTFYGRLE